MKTTTDEKERVVLGNPPFTVAPESIEFENEWEDTFNHVSGHSTRDTGTKTMLIFGLQPDEAELLKKHLTGQSAQKQPVSANFLWPHEDHSIEEAGYEFANAKTMEYQEHWWSILQKRIKQAYTQAKPVSGDAVDRVANHIYGTKDSLTHSMLSMDECRNIAKAAIACMPQPVEMGEEEAVEITTSAIVKEALAIEEVPVKEMLGGKILGKLGGAFFRALQSKAHIVKRDV